MGKRHQEVTLDALPIAPGRLCDRSGCTAAIAHNIKKALIAGKSSTPATVNLRRTLTKLGMHENAVEICDRYELKGSLGWGIRLGDYQEINYSILWGGRLALINGRARRPPDRKS